MWRKATEARLLGFLKKSPQFVIPIYQRTYNWTERECQQLWEDILRTGRNDQVSAHFVGSIVYVEKGLYQVSSQSPLLVIDGQQRLTTVTLLIEALSRSLGEQEPRLRFFTSPIRNRSRISRWLPPQCAPSPKFAEHSPTARREPWQCVEAPDKLRWPSGCSTS